MGGCRDSSVEDQEAMDVVTPETALANLRAIKYRSNQSLGHGLEQPAIGQPCVEQEFALNDF